MPLFGPGHPIRHSVPLIRQRRPLPASAHGAGFSFSTVAIISESHKSTRPCFTVGLSFYTLYITLTIIAHHWFRECKWVLCSLHSTTKKAMIIEQILFTIWGWLPCTGKGHLSFHSVPIGASKLLAFRKAGVLRCEIQRTHIMLPFCKKLSLYEPSQHVF